MAGDDYGSQDFFTKMGTVEGKLSALESITNSIVQKIKFKIDNQSLADGTY